MTRACGCPDTKGVTVIDAEQHAAWHELVAAQQAENDPRRRRLDVVSLPSHTVTDEKAVKTGRRASGARRRAARDD